jgi:TolA-binding protein
MMRRLGFLITVAFLQACASGGGNVAPTIGELPAIEAAAKATQPQPDVSTINPQVSFDPDRQQLIKSYRELIEITPQGKGYGKELRRLADLELEDSMDTRLSDQGEVAAQGELLSKLAIERYEQYLDAFPQRTDNDLILYQLARAYAIDSKPQKAQAFMDQLVREYPASIYRDEIQFRRGENLFVEGRYAEAERAYDDVVTNHPNSQYYDKALYKLGWSQFKQNRYKPALDSFMQLLDLKQQLGQLKPIALDAELSRADKELLQDALRVVSLAFSYLPQRQPISQYFNHTRKREYEPLLYKNLAQLYLSKDRISDATDVYLSYGEKYPFSRYTPEFHQLAIAADKKAGFTTLLLAEKKNFVKKYNRGTPFWQQQTAAVQSWLQPLLTAHLFDIATHYHALARAGKKRRDYQTAAVWYRKYLDSFPSDARAAQVNFLLAESLFDAGQYAQSIKEYEKAAYQYPPNKNSAEAAYAALLAYNHLLKKAKKSERVELENQMIQSSLNFSEIFPADKRAPKVLLSAAQKLYERKKYSQAHQAGLRLTQIPDLDKGIQRDSWLLLAQSGFQLKDYAASEQAYRNLIRLTSTKDRKQLSRLRNELAATIYKQGEAARTAGNHVLAAEHFLRASKIVPGSKTSIIAHYDAATEYIALQDWGNAIGLLEGFRKKYPNQKKWRLGVSQKLALAYNNSKQYKKAAAEMLILAKLSPKKDQRDLQWQSAQLYEQSGDENSAIKQYKIYIKKYPYPVTRSIELRNKIALFYKKHNDGKRYRYWLGEIVKSDARAKKQRTDRTRYLAALASLELIKPTRQKYSAVKLTRPLKKSLKRKKALMKQVVTAYSKAAKYQVEEVTTAATYNIAEIYREFADALLKSERPKKLDEDALEEYNYMLEDQAYPFEEKAIKIHQTNLSRIPKGSYDDAIKNSLKALAKLMPFRYAKVERTDDYAE